MEKKVANPATPQKGQQEFDSVSPGTSVKTKYCFKYQHLYYLHI